jgi:hypothetical protein
MCVKVQCSAEVTVSLLGGEAGIYGVGWRRTAYECGEALREYAQDEEYK